MGYKWVIRKFQFITPFGMDCLIEQKVFPKWFCSSPPDRAHYLIDPESNKVLARITHGSVFGWEWIIYGECIGSSRFLKTAKDDILKILKKEATNGKRQTEKKTD